MSIEWHSERSVRVRYERRRGEYEIVIVHWNVERSGEHVTWKVTAKGKPGANGTATDLEDAKAKSTRALDLLTQLAELQEARSR